MSENQLLEERIAAVMVRPVTLAHLVKPLLVDVLAALTQLRAEREALRAEVKRKQAGIEYILSQWPQTGRRPAARWQDMTAAELEAERKRHT